MNFVRAGVGQPSAWDFLHGQIYLGSESFVKRMQVLVTDRSAIAAAYDTGDYTMHEIATCFRVHYATVSRAVKKHEASMRDCKT